ncbi:RpiB/LacA/LacB family sugar-phosphate isomerase [Patescibacteria group bacterium]
MKIYFATDHAGFELKEKLVAYVKALGLTVYDKGAFEYNEEDDYIDFVAKAVKEVSDDPKNSRAIILGGSGQGEAMLANRFPNVRSAVYYGGNKEIVSLSREHNNSNILSLGARFLSEEEAKEVVKLWLDTKFSLEERHKRRVKKIDKITEFYD